MSVYQEISGPLWNDGCQHGTPRYIASFEVIEVKEGEVLRQQYDLYLFDSPMLGQEVCLRFGSEDSQYLSPGNIVNIFRTRDCPEYEAAVEVLLSKGYLTWVQGVLEDDGRNEESTG